MKRLLFHLKLVLTTLLLKGIDGKTNNNLESEDWGIQVESIRNAAYSFEEYPLDAAVGTILAEYPVKNVGSANLEEENEYIAVHLSNKSNSLQFVLTKPLTDFRKEQWVASIELNYNIFCSERSNATAKRTYTFMLIIQDCNSFAPIFNPDMNSLVYSTLIDDPFDLELPWPESLPLNNNREIYIVDQDINIKYANITLSCVEIDKSTSCENFDIVLTHKDSKNGHTYNVNMYFNSASNINRAKDIEVGTTFSIGLEASDSVHNVTQIINFTVKAQKAIGGSESDNSKFPVAEVVGGGSSLLAVIVIAFTYSTWRNQKTKNILRKLTEQEIREFLDGAAGFSGTIPKRSVDCNTPILAMPYNKAFEIQRDKLRIDETTILGTGFFGVVMKGSVIRENGESETVAVKAVKRNVGVLYFKALLSELKIMAFIKQHNNIVSLVGACTHNIRKREVFIAVEFCSNGNLHNYLRAYRDNFVNLVQNGRLCGVREIEVKSRKSSNCNNKLSTNDLIKWCTQIASGLDYLSSLGIIHGDLATRNILLTSELTAKIADFGLSRRLVDVSSYYYTKTSQAPLPWKWMSIESLKDMKFSRFSDIWSFGIVLWEVFTLGQTPYPGLNWDETFVERLEKGLRLPQPSLASNDLYNIMTDCWTADPHHRPAAFDIKRILETMSNALLNHKSSDDGYFRVLGAEKAVYIGERDSGCSSMLDDKSAYDEDIADC